MIDLANIDLTRFQDAIVENLTFLIDSITLEIVTEPVFVHYVDSQQVRVFSADSMRRSLDQINQSRTFVYLAENDPSGIGQLLEDLKEHTPLQKTFMGILRAWVVDLHLNAQQISELCRAFDGVYLLISSELDPSVSAETIALLRNQLEGVRFLDHFDNYLFARMMATDTPINDTLITVFATRLFLQQSQELATNKRKLLDDNERPLAENEMVCPFTKKKIDVVASLATNKEASDFVDLIIALGKLAKVKNSDMEAYIEFKESQDKKYLEHAHNKLVNYLQNPEPFNFDEAQKAFLVELGLGEVVKQVKKTKNGAGVINIDHKGKEKESSGLYKGPLENDQDLLNGQKNYNHLWSQEKTLQENVLGMLQDYSKLNAFSPGLALFFTRHWFRNHHQSIIEIVTAIQVEKEADEVFLADQLNTLEKQAKGHPKFNENGSLMRRLRFIRAHFTETAVDEHDESSQQHRIEL